MSLSGDAWAAVVFKTVVPDPTVLSPDEQNALMSKLKSLYATHVTYLTGAVVVQPNTFAVPMGVAVSTSGSATAQTGATTAAGQVGGTGKIS